MSLWHGCKYVDVQKTFTVLLVAFTILYSSYKLISCHTRQAQTCNPYISLYNIALWVMEGSSLMISATTLAAWTTCSSMYRLPVNCNPIGALIKSSGPV